MKTIEQAKQVVELLKDGQAGDCSPIGNRYAAIETINALIAELASIKGQEPVAWRYRLKPDWEKTWSAWLKCNREEYQGYAETQKVHCVSYEAQELYLEAGAQPMQPTVQQGWKLVKTPITESMHIAAVKVLHRASGLDGLPQRMLDAMLSEAPAAPVQAQERKSLIKPDGQCEECLTYNGHQDGCSKLKDQS